MIYYNVYRLEVQTMDYRLPYYMAYPAPFQYDDDKVERLDFDYMKSMYPQLAKKILPLVEEECERMDYEGSVIYDEYPDQLQIRLMCNRVYDKVKDMEEIVIDNLKEMIQLMLFQEIFRCRCEHRRKRRKFYL